MNNKTPAKVAGINVPYRNWKDVISEREIITPSMVSATSTVTIPKLNQPVKKAVKRKPIKRRQNKTVMPMLVGVRR